MIFPALTNPLGGAKPFEKLLGRLIIIPANPLKPAVPEHNMLGDLNLFQKGHDPGFIELPDEIQFVQTIFGLKEIPGHKSDDKIAVEDVIGNDFCPFFSRFDPLIVYQIPEKGDHIAVEYS